MNRECHHKCRWPPRSMQLCTTPRCPSAASESSHQLKMSETRTTWIIDRAKSFRELEDNYDATTHWRTVNSIRHKTRHARRIKPKKIRGMSVTSHRTHIGPRQHTETSLLGHSKPLSVPVKSSNIERSTKESCLKVRVTPVPFPVPSLYNTNPIGAYTL